MYEMSIICNCATFVSISSKYSLPSKDFILRKNMTCIFEVAMEMALRDIPIASSARR